MPVGLANMPVAKPAIKTATVRPTMIFSGSDILAFMALRPAGPADLVGAGQGPSHGGALEGMAVAVQTLAKNGAGSALAFRGSPPQSIIPAFLASCSAKMRAAV
jgi:hypothetical protein